MSLKKLQHDFESQLFFANKETLTWVHNNLLPIQLLEFSAQWEKIKLKKNGYAEALLYDYFNELFFNAFKYSDYQQIKLRFYEQQLDGVTYLVSTWENAYIDNTSISTSNGLEGIRDDLQMLNENAKIFSLQMIDNKTQKTFIVTLFLRQDLLIFEQVKRKYARLQ